MRVWHARALALREGTAFFSTGVRGRVTATLNDLGNTLMLNDKGGNPWKPARSILTDTHTS